MGIALLIIGLALVSTGVKNTQGALSAQLKSDFSGAGSFWYFIAGIFGLGAVGYYAPLQGASRLLIVLVILVLLLDNKGFFANLQSALGNPTPSTPTPADAAAASGASAASPTGGIVNQGLTALAGAAFSGTPGAGILTTNIPIPTSMGGP